MLRAKDCCLEGGQQHQKGKTIFQAALPSCGPQWQQPLSAKDLQRTRNPWRVAPQLGAISEPQNHLQVGSQLMEKHCTSKEPLVNHLAQGLVWAEEVQSWSGWARKVVQADASWFPSVGELPPPLQQYFGQKSLRKRKEETANGLDIWFQCPPFLIPGFSLLPVPSFSPGTQGTLLPLPLPSIPVPLGPPVSTCARVGHNLHTWKMKTGQKNQAQRNTAPHRAALRLAQL